MEKQSLIKYYCALFVLLVLVTGSNNAVAQTSPTTLPMDKAPMTASPMTTQSSENQNPKAEFDNITLFPIILSILALATSGGAIALTITEIKKITAITGFLEVITRIPDRIAPNERISSRKFVILFFFYF